MLARIGIKAKILSVLLLLGLISLSGLGYVSLRFSQANATYHGFITNESKAAVLGARAAAGIWTAVSMAGRLMELPATAPNYQPMKDKLNGDFKTAMERFQMVGEMVPSRKEAMAKILTIVGAVKSNFEKAIELSAAGDKAAVQEILIKNDELLKQMSSETGSNNTVMMDLLASGGEEMSASVNSTITTSIIGLGIGVVSSIALAFYVSHAGITAPMARLRERMTTLADGQTSGEIEGIGRADEIGQMAAAVAIFRDNAIERIKLAKEADSTRQLSEAERLQRDAERAKEAASVQHAVDELGAALNRLSDGDLAYRIETPFQGQLDNLRRNFNNSVEKLNQAMNSVGTNASAINAGATELLNAADDLAKRTEQQAASVEETAAALEQITTTVKDAAKRAEEASQLVLRTKGGAEVSGKVVNDAIDAMRHIENSSNEIANIIGVIDDIAFQTNLLALNAGVEAARAGDAGKGFAVVAQEVRELASRSANAAKEIKTLITASSQHVQSGVDLVAQTGTSLQKIVGEVQEINRHVQAIAEASREQSLGLQEINTAVNTMDQGTQQNAAMVEESTAASAALASEAQSLTEMLRQFRLSATATYRQSAASGSRRAA
ncbi:methyl-accepting chemotaxis sensory transducer with TarH sensor [Neorhizobium sp. R1-B]|uniref:methyl-accepting chemotaxis protein n=1 Tax=Neorhizobium sp. R1-B TaxID=2485162 RepID=UPI0010669CCE|nr:methyl-accepting chemotaxis protein [Neorhizobium sp. R1-B]TDX89046.1 methyl-accepting chemotaxis sensory transducer with TarH sensor [Neorhizobium sp. R1-B]